MSNICFTCGKKAVAGASQQHRRGVAGKRWKNRVNPTKRLFRPNLHTVTVTEHGHAMKVKMCAKCVKRQKKDAAFATL